MFFKAICTEPKGFYMKRLQTLNFTHVWRFRNSFSFSSFFLIVLLSLGRGGCRALGSSEEESEQGKGAMHAAIEIGGRMRLSYAKSDYSSECFRDHKNCFRTQTGALQQVVEAIESCGGKRNLGEKSRGGKGRKA